LIWINTFRQQIPDILTLKWQFRRGESSMAKRQRTAGQALSARKTALDTGNSQASLSEEDRCRMIAEAAYVHAERRGFSAGGELDDWLAAERELGRLLDHDSAALPGPGASGTVQPAAAGLAGKRARSGSRTSRKARASALHSG
jgi:hypothetical protein